MQTRLLVCASRVIVDRNDNKVSALDIFDDMIPAGFPLTLPQLYVLWTLEREPADADVISGKIELIQNDKLIGTSDVEISFQNLQTTRAIVVFNAVPFAGPGEVSLVANIPSVQEFSPARFKFRIMNPPV